MADDSLPRLWDERAPLPPEVARRHLRALLEALAELHDNGRKHGDLYVNHVLLRPDGQIHLVGEGLAADEDDRRPKHNPSMYPPELLKGERTSQASDIWSVGVHAYWMLTGRDPFEGDSTFQAFRAITQEPPDELDPGLPARLAEFTRRCLQPDPSDRFANAREALAGM